MASLLRCPTSARVVRAPWHLSTAATRSPPSPRPRRRSGRSPPAYCILHLRISADAKKQIPEWVSLRRYPRRRFVCILSRNLRDKIKVRLGRALAANSPPGCWNLFSNLRGCKKSRYPNGFPFVDTPAGDSLHFCLPPQAKIKVATSVCTGGSNMPPAYCILHLRISADAKRHLLFLVIRRRFELRTHCLKGNCSAN